MTLAEKLGRYLPPSFMAEVEESWSPHWRELFKERAAIKEYEAGKTREQADREAFAEIHLAMRRRPADA